MRSAPLKMTKVIAPKMNRMMKLAKVPRHNAPRMASRLISKAWVPYFRRSNHSLA